MKMRTLLYSVALTLLMGSLAACEDMLDVSSSSVQYEDRHELSSAADSLYSVVGILSKLQAIADRTVLLGELRGDLVTDNENTEEDLRELINHEVSADNKYTDYSDYYAIINNCNYYLDKVDTNVVVSNQKVMLREVAVVKAIRAWTYMQLALIYQSVPFITKPILTLEDAEYWEKECEYKDLDAMCDYFIPELLPYINTDLPSYGDISGYNSKRLFFPISLLLGDMCLWKQYYSEAFSLYAYYAYKEQLKTYFHGVKASGFSSLTNDILGPAGTYTTSVENITVIRMASSKLYGTVTDLENIFSPTELNEGRRSVSPSRLWKELSEKQVFAYQQSAESAVRYLTCGDLRAIGTYRYEWSDGTLNSSMGGSNDAWYVLDVDNPYRINGKFGGYTLLAEYNSICIYRIGNVFLRMAEALNRLGYPQEAFYILKYGVEAVNMSVAGTFSLEYPRSEDVVGIHSRGSGSSAANEEYDIDCSDFNFDIQPDSVSGPQMSYVWGYVEDSLVKMDSTVHFRTYYGRSGMPNPNVDFGYYGNETAISDSIHSTGKGVDGLADNTVPDTMRYTHVPAAYLIDKVEQMIVDEMALETAFEGHRYYDLMRVAMRRGDPDFLARKIAHRNGEEEEPNSELYDKLNDPTYSNWYIHKK